MIEITKSKAFNFDGAFRGMRQPFKNTDKADSIFTHAFIDDVGDVISNWINETQGDISEIEFFRKSKNAFANGCIELSSNVYEINLIGLKDMKLAQKLINGGSPHDKYLRQILVSMDINAPLYW